MDPKHENMDLSSVYILSKGHEQERIEKSTERMQRVHGPENSSMDLEHGPGTWTWNMDLEHGREIPEQCIYSARGMSKRETSP